MFMKKIKKIVAIWLLTSLVFTNIPVINAEWIHTERKLIHKPFWLFWPQDKTRMKDEQLCENGYSFNILDEYWNTIDKYIPEGCKKKSYKETFDIVEEEEIQDQDYYEDTNIQEDNFINDIFGEEEIQDYYEDTSIQENDFINDIFDEDDFIEEPSDYSAENENNEQNYYEEINTDTNTEKTEDEEIDNFLEDIFWKKINNKLDVSNIEKQLKLWAKNLVSTVKNFADAKLELNMWAITVNLIKSQPE